jgi:hypothetical protein
MRDPVMTALKVRENRARRVLVRMGYWLENSPRRDDRAIDFCLYRIVAAAGPPASGSYTMILPEIEAWIDADPAERARLAAKCILAGSPPGAWILDPFARTGVTGMAAAQHGRSAMLIELSEHYAKIIRKNLGDRLTETSVT